MREILTHTEKLSVDASGIVRCKVLKDTHMRLEDAMENIRAIKELAQGKKVAVLVDITESKGADKAARDFFGSDEVASVQSACALLVNSPLSQLLGNFFLGFNKTQFPTKLFTDEEKAIQWLESFIVTNGQK